MVVGGCFGMEKIDEKDLFTHEAAADKWIGEIKDRNRVVVQVPQSLVYIQLISLDFRIRSGSSAEGAEFKVSIVNINGCKLGTRRTLLDFFEFDEV
jgi:hypothetical protein